MFGLLARIVPLALRLIPVAERFIGAGQGPAKRKIVIDLIVPVIQAYETLRNKEVVDETALAMEVGLLVDAIVGIANLFGLLDEG